MTKHEGAVLTAFTGILLTDFNYFHEYAEELTGHSIMTHEMVDPMLWNELEELSVLEARKIIKEQV